MAKKSNSANSPMLSHDIPDSSALDASYGPSVQDPRGFAKGGVTTLGWLAGSGDVCTRRNIAVDDSAEQGKGRKKA